MRAQPADVSTAEEVDARITYPCYKSLDEFIAVGWLKSLDGPVREGIPRLTKGGLLPEPPPARLLGPRDARLKGGLADADETGRALQLPRPRPSK